MAEHVMNIVTDLSIVMIADIFASFVPDPLLVLDRRRRLQAEWRVWGRLNLLFSM
jgi:hypothetical protein